MQHLTYPGITRHEIYPNADGTWTILDEGLKSKTKDWNASEICITAAEVFHSPEVTSFGYAVSEAYIPRKIIMDKARALGVEKSEKLTKLKQGFPVMSDDGERLVDPEAVLGPVVDPRKFVFEIPPVMTRLCQGADVLVHEATMLEEKFSIRRSWGHSTPSMAGRFADSVGAKLLVLNHFGPGNSAAKAELKNKDARAVAAFDFMKILVPRGGFKFGRAFHESQDSADAQLDDAAGGGGGSN